jgi:hypothetical protein
MDDFGPKEGQVKPLRELQVANPVDGPARQSQGNDKLDELREAGRRDQAGSTAQGNGYYGGINGEAQQAAAGRHPQLKPRRSLLDQIVEEGRIARDPAGKERGKNLVKEFVAQVLEGSMTVSKDAEAMINARIAQIDHLLSIQLNEILHNPAFQKLEASWRGLKYLLDQSETSDKLKIKVLNVNKKDLLRDLQRAPEFDQSAMFKKVYEEEYGARRRAVRALIGDYEFGRTPEDIELLEKVSQVASAAHAPLDRLVGGDAEHGQLHQHRRASRHGKDLRQHGIRQVEVVPAERGFPLCRLVPAALPDAPAIWQEQQDHRIVHV